TQAEVYKRVTGRDCATDEDKALAAWLWRNTHYWRAKEGREDLWGEGFGKGQDTRTREYWTGLFAHGFGLCGTTHCQWIGEMEARLGPGPGRGVRGGGARALGGVRGVRRQRVRGLPDGRPVRRRQVGPPRPRPVKRRVRPGG